MAQMSRTELAKLFARASRREFARGQAAFQNREMPNREFEMADGFSRSNGFEVLANIFRENLGDETFLFIAETLKEILSDPEAAYRLAEMYKNKEA